MSPALLDALTGWALFLGLVLAVGAVTARWVILPRAGASVEPAASVGLLGAVVGLGGLAAYFARQLLEFRDPFVPWTEDASLLLGTAWGTSWKGASAAMVLLLVGFGLARARRSTGWLIATPVALTVAAFPGLTGHAAGMEEGRTLALFADWLHVTGAGAWIGGLAVVLWAARDSSMRGAPLARLVPAFSPVAMTAVAVLILTGAYASWLHLPELGALVSTRYGRTLSLKLILAAVVLGLGARNFRSLTPRLGSPDGDEAMRRSATAELLIAQAVLVATALLVRTSPMDP